MAPADGRGAPSSAGSNGGSGGLVSPRPRSRPSSPCAGTSRPGPGHNVPPARRPRRAPSAEHAIGHTQGFLPRLAIGLVLGTPVYFVASRARRRLAPWLERSNSAARICVLQSGGPRGLARPALRRSRRHRLIAGVCGGIAAWLGWPAWLVRALFVVGSIVPVVPGFLVYLLLWLVMPLTDSAVATHTRTSG